MAAPDASGSPRLQPPGFAQAVARVFDLSLPQMLWSRRTVFMALVVGAPVLIGILFRALQFLSIHTVRVNSIPIGGSAIFGIMMWLLYLRFTVPILGVFYGTALIADEVDDKTITYLFTRPISRSAVMVGKYLAGLVSTVMVVLPSVMLVFFLVIPTQASAIAEAFPALVKDLAILGLGLAVYSAIFALVGALLRYPLIIGLVFTFGWEQLAMLLPGYLRKFTIAYYLQGLVPHAMPKDTTMSLLQSFFADAPSATVAISTLGGICLVALFLAGLAIERRE